MKKVNKKFIPYGRQNIDGSDIKAVTNVLKSDWLTQGPSIKAFEGVLARYSGAKYAIAVSSGTAALHVAYLAAGIKTGDEVITTANTFVATTNMLLALGANGPLAPLLSAPGFSYLRTPSRWSFQRSVTVGRKRS